jgi:hypothetical protein
MFGEAAQTSLGGFPASMVAKQPTIDGQASLGHFVWRECF